MISLYNECCLEGLKRIEDDSVDFALCDIPFNLTRARHDQDKVPLEPLWEQLNRACKANACIAMFGKEPFSSKLRMSNLKDYRYDWVWEKGAATGFLNAKRMPLVAHECISVFYRKKPTYNPQKTSGHIRKISLRVKEHQVDAYGDMDKDNYYDSTERYPRSVIKFSADTQKSSLISFQKPVALLEYLIRTYTNEGEIVLDPTFGSCSTGVACLNTGREFIGFEKDSEIFEIGKKRIDEHSIFLEESLVVIDEECC